MMWFNYLWGVVDLLPAVGRSLSFRGYLASRVLMKCGANLKVSKGVVMYKPNSYVFGDNVYLGLRNYLGNGKIRLGNEVMTGPNVCLVPGNHTLSRGSWRYGPYSTGQVVVEDGVWIGANVVVVEGVTIGRGSLIAAGTVVTRDVPPNVVFAGVPGKVVRSCDNE